MFWRNKTKSAANEVLLPRFMTANDADSAQGRISLNRGSSDSLAGDPRSCTASNLFSTDHLHHDLKGRSIRGAALMLTAQSAKLFIGLGSTVVLARLLSPADYGVVAMVAAVTGFVAVLKDGGLATATIQRSEINSAQISTLFWINTALGVAVALVVGALSPLVAWFYRDPRLLWVAMVLAIPFVFGGLSVQHQALLQRQMRFKTLATVDIVSLLISVSAGVIMAARGDRYWALVGMSVTGAIVNCILIWATCQWRPARPARGAGVRSMLAFGGGVTLYGVLGTLAGSADKLFLGKFFGAEAVGFYSRAQALFFQPLQQVIPTLQTVGFPMLSRLSGDVNRFRSTFLRLVSLAAIGSSLVSAFLLSASDAIVSLALGDKWLASSTIFQMFAVTIFTMPVSVVITWLFLANARSREMAVWGALNSGVLLIAVTCGLPWGGVGVAAAYSISGAFIRVPLLCYLAGRIGILTSAELLRTLGLATLTCFSVTLCLVALRHILQLNQPWKVLILILPLNALLHLALLACSQWGRSCLSSTKEIALILLRATPLRVPPPTTLAAR